MTDADGGAREEQLWALRSLARLIVANPRKPSWGIQREFAILSVDADDTVPNAGRSWKSDEATEPDMQRDT